MEISERYKALREKAISIQSEINTTSSNVKEVREKYEQIKQKLDKEREALSIQNLTVDSFKEIIDRMSQESIEKVAALLTYALQIIFYDKEYSVEVVTGDKRNVKTAELVLVEKSDSGVVRSPFDDGIGGGIIAICGLILQVYYISLYQLSPIVFMDEALSQVSSEYISTMMSFIKELAASKDFIMVLISHDNRYMSYADRTYRVIDGCVEEAVNGNS